MKILGIESSCDETAAAVVQDGCKLLSNVVHTQIDIHAQYGGVVPEVAARSHIEVINPVIDQALADADCTWDDIDAIAVTYAPGLIGSLLVGTLAARTLAIIHDKPLYAIHHVEAHVYANFIIEKRDTSVEPILSPLLEGDAPDRASQAPQNEQGSPVERPLRKEGAGGGERDSTPVVDLYSGVGTIGLTIGGDNVTLVEVNEHAVREMQQNIKKLGKSGAKAVLAASENALDYISGDATIIVDPPRAGLHERVIAKLLETAPQRIIYLSCNPVTQARDVALLAEKYGIRHHQGYNFFPRTPHIEHLVVLEKII